MIELARPGSLCMMCMLYSCIWYVYVSIIIADTKYAHVMCMFLAIVVYTAFMHAFNLARARCFSGRTHSVCACVQFCTKLTMQRSMRPAWYVVQY